MKIILGVILALTVSLPVFSAEYKIKCLNPKGKMSDCKVLIDGQNLTVRFSSKEEETISGKNIKALYAGEYSRRRVAEAVILTPWLLFSKKKRDQVSVEYTDNGNSTKAITFELKKKYGFAFKNELRALSGKPIQEEEKSKK